MSELKLKGKIKQINDVQEFDSGFRKVEFIITTHEKYPQDVKFEIVNDKADGFIQHNKVDDNVEVKFNVRGNEYQGKFYVNLQAWYVSKAGESQPQEKVAETDDLPF